MSPRAPKRGFNKKPQRAAPELAPPTHLKAWRLFFGWTQEYLADLMGVAAHTQISYWENGKNNMPLPAIHRAARLFGITPGRLIDGPPPLASDFASQRRPGPAKVAAHLAAKSPKIA
jgi:transcriptional regulator with XRE-family HTH domain